MLAKDVVAHRESKPNLLLADMLLPEDSPAVCNHLAYMSSQTYRGSKKRTGKRPAGSLERDLEDAMEACHMGIYKGCVAN